MKESPPRKSAVSRAVRRFVRVPLREAKRRLMIRLGKMFASDKNDSPAFVCKGKDVSVLLPSRGRPDALRAALRNLAETCEKPERVEILVRLDDDDAAALAVRDSLAAECAPVDLRIIVGPRGGGYRTFHNFVNELCAVARGDFLFLYNDDSRIETRGWDRQTAAERENLCVLNPATPENPSRNIFPLAHRKVVEILGRFSPIPFCDAWVQDVADAAGVHREMPLFVIRHLRDEMADATFAETSAAQQYAQDTYRSAASAFRRGRDAGILARHVARCGRKLEIRESE